MGMFEQIKEFLKEPDDNSPIIKNKLILWALRILWFPVLGLIVWACLLSDPDVLGVIVGVFWASLGFMGCIWIFGYNYITKVSFVFGVSIFLLEIFGVIIFLCVCLLLGMLNSYYVFPQYMTVGWVLLGISILSLVSWAMCVKAKTDFRWIVASRIVFLTTVPIASLYLAILQTYVTTTTEEPLYNFVCNYLMISYILCFLCFIVILGLSYDSDVFSFSGKMDYLYLRSFEYEKTNSEIPNQIKSILDEHDIKPLTIGDPSNLSFGALFGTKHFYLPITDWKSAVNYYIKKISNIIVVIDTTPGVIWEIFSHSQYTSKFLYIVDDVNKFHELLDKIKDEAEYRQMYDKFLLVKDHVSDRFAFWFAGNNVLYGPLNETLNRFINFRKKDISEGEPVHKDASKGEKSKFGAFAKIEKLRKGFLYIPGGLFAIAVMLLFLAVIVLALFAVVMLFISLVHLADLYDIFTIESVSDLLSDFDKEDTWGSILGSALMIGFGWYAIRELKKS